MALLPAALVVRASVACVFDPPLGQESCDVSPEKKSSESLRELGCTSCEAGFRIVDSLISERSFSGDRPGESIAGRFRLVEETAGVEVVGPTAKKTK